MEARNNPLFSRSERSSEEIVYDDDPGTGEMSCEIVDDDHDAELQTNHQLLPTPQPGDPAPGIQVVRQASTGLGYLLHLPKAYDTIGEAWPLLIFLHGAGESAPPYNPASLVSLGLSGCPTHQPAEMEDRFVVASPQTGEGWSGKNAHAAVLDLLDDLLRDHNLDCCRIYLTGVSMGGSGVWSLATEHPSRFTAVAPVCGFSTPRIVMRIAEGALKTVPVWNFHGANDEVVPPIGSNRLVDACKKAGVDVQYTLYAHSPPPPGYPSYRGHASWMQAYSDPELWAWLLSKTKNTTTSQ